MARNFGIEEDLVPTAGRLAAEQKAARDKLDAEKAARLDSALKVKLLNADKARILSQRISTEYPAPPLQNVPVAAAAPVSRRSAAGISWENPEYTSATGQRVFPIPIPIDRSKEVRVGVVPAVPTQRTAQGVSQQSQYNEQIIGKDAPTRIGLHNLTNVNEYVPGNIAIPEVNRPPVTAKPVAVTAPGIGPQFNKDNQFVGSDEEFKRYVGNGNDTAGPTGIGYVETLDKKGRPTGMVRVENAKYTPDENPQLPRNMDPRALSAAIELYKASRSGGELTAAQILAKESRDDAARRAEKTSWDAIFAKPEYEGMKPDFRAGIIESLKLGHPIPQEYKPMVDEVKNGFNKWLNSPSKVKGKTRKVLFEEQVKANGETLDSPGVRLKLLEGFQADEIAKQTQKEK